MLRNEIVPRLLKDVPPQHTPVRKVCRPGGEEEFTRDRYLARFTLVFDREGYSTEFFKEMWEKHRIACITYNKYPKGEK
ncbi:MAG: hypothetical protein SCARUB_03979 [Candidatus Scalindua rubra]|uniref:Uncharacterized protein n=1 Tax=Candidatus Scalindua rubra TaxID=1872076 RepID=A0A1E3X5J6_9BACT|nr:MAG: hypothetical protein SCARUB_03979 [Candidatus Scalindua rubra]